MLNNFLCITAFILTICLITGCDEKHDPSIQGYVEGDYTFISSPYGGRLTSINVLRGQQVKKNELLFSLDLQPQQLEFQIQQKSLKESESNLKNLQKNKRPPVIKALKAQKSRSEAQLKLFEARYRRNKTLYKTNVIDADSLDFSLSQKLQAQSDINQYEAQIQNALLASRVDVIDAQKEKVESQKKQVNKAKWALEQKTLQAPYDSEVVDVFYRQGEYVKPALPVLSLLDEKNKQIIFYVKDKMLSQIKLGQTIFLDCLACKNQTAKINYIANYAEFAPPVIYSRQSNAKLVFKVRAVPEMPTLLHPGQPISVFLKALK